MVHRLWPITLFISFACAHLWLQLLALCCIEFGRAIQLQYSRSLHCTHWGSHYYAASHCSSSKSPRLWCEWDNIFSAIVSFRETAKWSTKRHSGKWGRSIKFGPDQLSISMASLIIIHILFIRQERHWRVAHKNPPFVVAGGTYRQIPCVVWPAGHGSDCG